VLLEREAENRFEKYVTWIGETIQFFSQKEYGMILTVTPKNCATLVSRDVDDNMSVIENVIFCAGTFRNHRRVKRWAKRYLPNIKVEFADSENTVESAWQAADELGVM